MTLSLDKIPVPVLVVGGGVLLLLPLAFGLRKAGEGVGEAVGAAGSATARAIDATVRGGEAVGELAARQARESPNIFAATANAITEVVTLGNATTLGEGIFKAQQAIEGLFK